MMIRDDAFRSRFEIRRELGRGGMGEVHLAHDTYMQREVAIKLTHLKALDDPEDGQRMRKMWLNETRLAGKLHHPYIVEIYESGVVDEFGYLVMEYVEGDTLKQYTARDKLLDFEAIIEIVYKVCRALNYANRQGLLHRDIKPANVMLTADRTVKIADFGTCYLTDVDETQVFDVGTLPFMPPEHFTRRSPTMQSDIYAVGVMAYQLLTGMLPFNADSYQNMIYQKLNDDFVPLDTRRKDIPQKLRFAVHRAIHKDTEIRYASWDEFCEDLALALPQLSLPGEVRFDSARYKVLQGLDFFSEFTDAQLWETIHISTWLFKSESEVVFEKDSVGGNLYVITSGEVVVMHEGAILNRLATGECFGEVAYLDEQTHARSATVRAATGAVMLEIDAESLRQASASLQAVFSRAFMRLMVSRIKNADRRYLEMIANPR